jgi:hypothetical protein
MSLVSRVKQFVSSYPDLYNKGKVLASAYVGSRRKSATSEQKKAYGLAIWKAYYPQVVAVPVVALCSLIAGCEATYAMKLHHTTIYPTWDMQSEYAIDECRKIKSLEQIDSEIRKEEENKIFSAKTREQRIAGSLAAYETIRPYLELRKDHPPFTHMLEAANRKKSNLTRST